MTVFAGFDVHRAQITFDALDTETGEITCGRIESTPAGVERWVARFPGRGIHVAVEACTGWLFVCNALARAGAVAHLAEPVETSALRGRKRRAKTDREDAQVAPRAAHRRAATGIVDPARACASMANASAAAKDTGRRADRVAPANPRDALSPRNQRIARACEHARWPRVPRQAGASDRCDRADHDRVGDDRSARDPDRPNRDGDSQARASANRLQGTDDPVRDGRADLADHADRARGRLPDARLPPSRSAAPGSMLACTAQTEPRASGSSPTKDPPELRWALYEAAQSACRPSSPDHQAYLALKDRGLSHTRASLTIARKLARRSYHVLRELGPAALEPLSHEADTSDPPSSPSITDANTSGQLPQPCWLPRHHRGGPR